MLPYEDELTSTKISTGMSIRPPELAPPILTVNCQFMCPVMNSLWLDDGVEVVASRISGRFVLCGFASANRLVNGSFRRGLI